jgi:hypothetical protein
MDNNLQIDRQKFNQNYVKENDKCLSVGLTPASVFASLNALKESNNKIAKTPITVLQEICTKSRANPPEFADMDGNCGKVHDPVFKCECRLFELRAIGTGHSKKKAKHKSALEMLKKVQELNAKDHPKESEDLKEIV